LVADYRSWQTDGRENESAVGYWMGFCSSFERYKKLSEWSQIAPESSNQQRRRKGLRTALSSADPIVPEAEDWQARIDLSPSLDCYIYQPTRVHNLLGTPHIHSSEQFIVRPEQGSHPQWLGESIGSPPPIPNREAEVFETLAALNHSGSHLLGLSHDANRSP